MKTKLEMAHEYAMQHLKNSGGKITMHNLCLFAWQYADAMQAEVDKREKQKDEDDAKSSKVLFEKLTDSRSLTKDEHGNCLHFHREFGHKKCMDCGSSLEKWQPDWSQAPKTAIAWEMRYGSSTEARWVHNQCIAGFEYSVAPSFGYTGDWRESLRKRPK
jgi:hypothetical protein